MFLSLRCKKSFLHLKTSELVRRKISLLHSIMTCSGSLPVMNLLLDVIALTTKSPFGESMPMWKREACLLLGEIIDGKILLHIRIKHAVL